MVRGEWREYVEDVVCGRSMWKHGVSEGVSEGVCGGRDRG